MKAMMTNAQLLAALKEGLSSAEIAERHGITAAAVNARRARLRFKATSIAVVAEPEAQRLVTQEMDTLALLQACMERLTLLSDAYHEWLLDPKDRRRYTIGPRATEIEVVYFEPGREEARKATLQELLHRVKSERCKSLAAELLCALEEESDRTSLQELLQRLEPRYEVQRVERKCADPRVEMRATVTTISATVAQMVELAQMLADAHAMQVLRDSILEELRNIDAEVAARIVSALRSRFVVGGVPYRTGAVDSGVGARKQ